MKVKDSSCEQCGATDFTRENDSTVRCNYCHSLYQLETPDDSGPSVVIKSGANVTFGKNSKVVIQGGLEIEDGANVEILGQLTLLEKASEVEIAKAKEKLASEK